MNMATIKKQVVSDSFKQALLEDVYFAVQEIMEMYFNINIEQKAVCVLDACTDYKISYHYV